VIFIAQLDGFHAPNMTAVAAGCNRTVRENAGRSGAAGFAGRRPLALFPAGPRLRRMRTALIAGASGLVGGFLLRQLLDSPAYDRVIALGRRGPGLTHPKLAFVQADFGALDKVAAEVACDDAFCCLGTTIRRAGSRAGFRAVDHAAVLAFAWLARRNGAKRFFVVSALGANAASRVFYNRVKGEMEEALVVLDFPTLAIFRPGLLLGPRVEVRPVERVSAVLLWLAEPLLRGPLRRYRAIQASTVARAMLRCSLGKPGQGVLIFPSDRIADPGAFEA
jgi:uncharacterized protein YbjT (DUF2867 family)